MNPSVASLLRRECPEPAEDDSESARRGHEPLTCDQPDLSLRPGPGKVK